MFYKDIVKCNLNFIKMSWCLYAWSLSFLKYKIKWIIWYFFSFHQGEITLQKSLGTQWPASKKWALVLVIFILLSSLSCSKYLITFLMIQNWSTALHYTLNIFVQKKIVLIFRQWPNIPNWHLKKKGIITVKNTFVESVFMPANTLLIFLLKDKWI